MAATEEAILGALEDLLYSGMIEVDLFTHEKQLMSQLRAFQ